MISNLFASIYKIWPFLVLFFGAFFMNKKNSIIMGKSNMLLFIYLFFHLGLIVRENPVYSVISKWRKTLSWALWLVNFRIRSLVLKEIGHWCLQQLIWTDERWIFGCLIVLLDKVGSYLYVGVFMLLHWVEIKKKGWRPRVLWVYGNCSMDGLFD